MAEPENETEEFEIEMTPQMEELANRFREGIARALGIPPEMVSEERVKKWLRNWVRAWTKPAPVVRAGILRALLFGQSSPMPSKEEVYRLGYELGTILRSALKHGSQ